MNSNCFFLQELFDCIALELAKFISENGKATDDSPERKKVLGFIVSYPVDQAAASSGAAIKWKSFSVTDTVECVFSVFLLLFFPIFFFWTWFPRNCLKSVRNHCLVRGFLINLACDYPTCTNFSSQQPILA